jgi:hypothetical protein
MFRGGAMSLGRKLVQLGGFTVLPVHGAPSW